MRKELGSQAFIFEKFGKDPFLVDAVRIKWVKSFIEMLYIHSPWTLEHSVRVAQIMRQLAHALGIPYMNELMLAQAGLVHDVGKLEVSREVLDAKTLGEQEWAALRDHPRTGFELVKGEDYFIAKIIIAHHEWQGSPYPRMVPRIHSVDQPLIQFQKLVALADGIDALMSKRPYKEAWSDETTFDYLKERFDPKLVSVGIKARSRLRIF